MVWPLIQAAIAIVGAGASVAGGISAKNAASRVSGISAEAEGILTQSKLLQIDAEEKQLKGQTIGAAAGSGVVANRGSPIQLLIEQAKQFEQERFTVARAGATRTAAASARSSIAASSAMYSGIGNAASSLASAFSLISNSSANASTGGGGGGGGN